MTHDFDREALPYWREHAPAYADALERGMTMRDIMVGDTVTCAACGQRVTATVQTHSNLTALVGLPLVRCVDGSEFHPWPDNGCPIHGWSHA
jgi:hypothetical protein